MGVNGFGWAFINGKWKIENGKLFKKMKCIGAKNYTLQRLGKIGEW